MPNKKGHRQFGSIRKLPSGKFQARYLGPDGITRRAPQTFASTKEAASWLTVAESEILRGEWIAPEAGEVLLSEYGEKWIKERKLRPRTRVVYESLWRLHIHSYLGKLALAQIKPQTIRSWRTKLLAEGVSEGMAARSYALLRAILSTAVKQDEILMKNPCRIPGFDQWTVEERPTATVAQVDALTAAMPARFRALIVCAALLGLRWSELTGLRRCDVDLDLGKVRVVVSKSAAGLRSIALPREVITALRAHLHEFVGDGVEDLIFTGAKGARLNPGNWRRAVRWEKTLAAVGLPATFHFHDLRHTSNNLAAATGASTRELMHRMGHSTMRAALIYQHANSERDHEIARAIDERLARQRAGTKAGEPTTDGG